MTAIVMMTNARPRVRSTTNPASATPAPTADELEILRTRIDPQGVYL